MELVVDPRERVEEDARTPLDSLAVDGDSCRAGELRQVLEHMADRVEVVVGPVGVVGLEGGADPLVVVDDRRECVAKRRL